MSFGDQLRAFKMKVETRQQEIFTGVVDLAHESIQTGSPITGAPGQPVDTGNLRASWQKSYPAPFEAEIGTNAAYAPFIEEGITSRGGLTLRSAVGGFHSVKLTVVSWLRIVEAVTRRVNGTTA